MSTRWLDVARGLVRPVVTVALVGATIAFVAARLTVPEYFSTLVSIVVGYWFGARQSVK